MPRGKVIKKVHNSGAILANSAVKNKKLKVNNFIKKRKRPKRIIQSESNSEHSENNSEVTLDELQSSAKITKTDASSDTNSASSASSATKHMNKQVSINDIIQKRAVTMTTYNVPTSNSFDDLTIENDEQNDDNMEQDNTTDQDNEERNEITKQKMPPPIILHGNSKNHARLVTAIKQHVEGNFNVKHTKNNVNITIENREQRTNFIQYLINDKTEFHTYSDTTEKTHAFVIRGLTNDVDATELGEELKSIHKIPVVKCYKMEFKKYPRPSNQALFLLVTTNKSTLKSLATVRYVMHARIYFERRRNTRQITQCHKCQQWGHATSNCHANTKCMYCALNHETKTCDRKPENIKCANCKGNHQANDTQCRDYIDKINWLESQARQYKPRQNQRHEYEHRDEDFPTTFKPAPPPQQNAWKQRAELNQQHQRHAQQPPDRRQHQPSSQTSPQQPPVTRTTPAPAQTHTHTNTFQKLTEQFDILHSMVNIDALLHAITDLNTQLQTCRTSEQKFFTFTNFTKDIHKYDI